MRIQYLIYVPVVDHGYIVVPVCNVLQSLFHVVPEEFYVQAVVVVVFYRQNEGRMPSNSTSQRLQR